MLKHIIWDFDGTLFDTYPKLTETFAKMLKDIDIDEPQEEITKHFKISFPHTSDYYQKKYNLSFNIEERYTKYKNKYIKPADSKPFPYIQEICKKIYSSGKYNYLYTHKDITAIKLLENYDIKNYFKDFITKENGFKRKPEPDAILYFVKKYKMNPNETVLIGDRDLDILSGKNAGIKTCYFDELNDNRIDYCDYHITSIKDLENIIF